MTQLELAALVVREYEPAIRFFVDVLGFELVEDIPSLTNDGRPKRWVVVRPLGAVTGVLLARADGERQAAIIGDQFAGRVGFFLRVDDFDATYSRMVAAGVTFTTAPRVEPYGRVAVFLDLEGNKWDLLGPRKSVVAAANETEQFLDAVKRGDLQTTRDMLGRNRELAVARDANGATPLHYAAFNGYQEIVRALAENGADINARDGAHNATPTGWAVEYLRELGGFLAIEIEDLQFAIERRDIELTARILSRHPTLARATDRDGVLLSDRAKSDPEISEVFKKFAIAT